MGMKKQSIWKNIRSYFQPDCETIVPQKLQKLRLTGKEVRVPIDGFPVFEIQLGKQIVHLQPDPGLRTNGGNLPYDFILFDPQRYANGIAHLQRLAPGTTLSIDSDVEHQQYVFSLPREAFRRHFSVSHEGDALVFRDPISELGTYVSLIGSEPQESRPINRRVRALLQVKEIFGGALETLSPAAANATLMQVNQLLAKDAWRQLDGFGNPGGVVELPEQLTPIVLGDLHAEVDNLLKILSENTFMECLQQGKAALILLGDAVHPERPESAASMDSSLLMMDLIFKLKLRFPKQVFYIIGNHDSFSHDLMKLGVPQGLLWEKHVTQTRGEEYRAALELFYRQSPLAVVSRDFIACHAGPVRAKCSLQTLINIRQFPDMIHEITWNRTRSSRFPTGYTGSDVRRFRKSLQVEHNTPFIVGHYPRPGGGTLWSNVDNIQQHHVVMSCRPDCIGLFTRVDGKMVPQTYPTEALTEWLNGQTGPVEVATNEPVLIELDFHNVAR
ncbi:MAG: metallophosphoesterase family protein [Pseudomonadales bacterium]